MGKIENLTDMELLMGKPQSDTNRDLYAFIVATGSVLARQVGMDPKDFWEEVKQAKATVVSVMDQEQARQMEEMKAEYAKRHPGTEILFDLFESMAKKERG